MFRLAGNTMLVLVATLTPVTADTVQILSQQGHTGRITAIACSPNGEWIASAGEDRSVKIHDSRTGTILASFDDHTETILALAFSPDGRTLAGAGCDTKVRLYDTVAFRPKGVLQGHELCVTALHFKSTGDELAASSMDGKARIWHVPSGALRRTIAHPGIAKVAFSKELNGIITAGIGGEVKLHTPGSPVETVRAHRGPIGALALSASGKRFATAGSDGTVRVWNANGALHRKLGDGFLHANSLSFLDDGARLATGERDGSVRIWDLADGSVLSRHQEPVAIGSLAFHAGKKMLAVANGNSITLLKKGKPAYRIPGSLPFLEKIAIHPKRDELALGTGNGKVFIFDLSSGQLTHKIQPHRDRITALAYHPGGRTVASASKDETVILWNLNLKRRPWFNFVGFGGIRALHFDSSGRRLAVLERSGTVKIWDTAHRKLIATHRPPETLHSPVFHLQRKRLAGTAQNRRLKVFSLTTEKQAPMVGDESAGIAFSANGELLVSGGKDLRVWDLKNRTLLFSPGESSGSAAVSALSPDGSVLAATEHGRDIRLWNVRQKKLLRTVRSPNGPVTAIVFSADGQKFVAAGADNSAGVWSVPTGAFLLNLFLFPDEEWLLYHPEKLVYTSSTGGDGRAAVVFQGKTRNISPLRSYRGKLRVKHLKKAASGRRKKIQAHARNKESP